MFVLIRKKRAINVKFPVDGSYNCEPGKNHKPIM